MDFPTAKEAKESVRVSDEFTYHLGRIKKCIEDTSNDGNTQLVYSLGEDQYLYDKLYDFLTEKGYQVSWNRACLWVEISW